jgi:hypothetical protein
VDRLRIAGAVFIGLLWGTCVILVFTSRPADPQLLTLLTIITPVMLLPCGWLFTGPILNRRRERRDEAD